LTDKGLHTRESDRWFRQAGRKLVPQLTPTDCKVVWFIASLITDELLGEGNGPPSRSEIAKAVHCDRRNVIRATKHAVALGWLSVEPRGGRQTNGYRLTFPQ
jgi:hypothetical protein